jgi:hypothetical protein
MKQINVEGILKKPRKYSFSETLSLESELRSGSSMYLTAFSLTAPKVFLVLP